MSELDAAESHQKGGKVWVVAIHNYHPHLPNEWDGRHWSVRLDMKAFDAAMIKCACIGAGVPKAEGRRRVSLVITLGKGQRGGDPDAYWKSTLDALVHAGALVNDSKEWVEPGAVTYDRSAVKGTTITLEDVADYGRDLTPSPARVRRIRKKARKGGPKGGD